MNGEFPLIPVLAFGGLFIFLLVVSRLIPAAPAPTHCSGCGKPVDVYRADEYDEHSGNLSYSRFMVHCPDVSVHWDGRSWSASWYGDRGGHTRRQVGVGNLRAAGLTIPVSSDR